MSRLTLWRGVSFVSVLLMTLYVCLDVLNQLIFRMERGFKDQDTQLFVGITKLVSFNSKDKELEF